MKAFIRNLELISLVFNNYQHIQQLETLLNGYKLMKESEYSKEFPNEYNLNQKQIDTLVKVCEVSKRSRYKKELEENEFFINNMLKNYEVKEMPSYKKSHYSHMFD